MSVTMLDIAQLCSRYARRVKDRHVRGGLLTTIAGALFVLAYSLIPFWRALVHAARGGIVLEFEPDTRTLAASRILDFKLRRCVIEIHNGELALRPFRDAQVVAGARTAGLAAADAQDRRGCRSIPYYYGLVGSELDDEFRWLALLSKTPTRLPLLQGESRAHP